MVYKTFTSGDGSEISVWTTQSKQLIILVTDDENQPPTTIIIPDEDIEEFYNEIKKLYSEIKNG